MEQFRGQIGISEATQRFATPKTTATMSGHRVPRAWKPGKLEPQKPVQQNRKPGGDRVTAGNICQGRARAKALFPLFHLPTSHWLNWVGSLGNAVSMGQLRDSQRRAENECESKGQ